jgi:soluble lytic murein transglycosylase
MKITTRLRPLPSRLALAVALAALTVFLVTSSRPGTAAASQTSVRSQLRAAAAAGNEAELQRIETSFPRTEDAALARLLRGYLRLQAKDFNNAATILDDAAIGRHSKLGDYALYYRGQALQGAGRNDEAERVFSKLAASHPTSLFARAAALQAAGSAVLRGAYDAALKDLAGLVAENDGTALKLRADALEKMGQTEGAVAALRKIYFDAPHSAEAATVANRLTALGAGAPSEGATLAMLRGRADKLYQANLHVLAAQAYDQLARQFPAAADSEVLLRAGVSYYKARSYQQALNVLNTLGQVRARTPKSQAEAIYYRGLSYRALRQDAGALQAVGELRRVAPGGNQLGSLLYELGRAYETSQPAQAATYYEQVVREAPKSEQADEAHFWLAWRAHEADDYARSAKLLIEHIADYGDVTDNRGKAAFWAARDAERSGDRSRALVMYNALLPRYGAGWYGYNSERRIAQLKAAGITELDSEADRTLARAVAALQVNPPVVETMKPADEERLAKADQLLAIALQQSALNELEDARSRAATSPRINLRIAQIYRSRNENVSAVNVLKRAYPDYGQALLHEMPREAWDVFYPLGWWSLIKQEAARHKLDPYMIAGLIRQESVFNPQARSRANALGLMQIIPSTGRMVARQYNVGGGSFTPADLYNPAINVPIGTAYVAQLLEQFGRFEYVAASYNGGPTRVARWLRELPAAEIEDWVDSIPISETRLYVQGVYRNARQYQRLYDEQGRFKPGVGGGQ